LGGFLLGGGLVAVAMPLGLATNADDLELWERLASLGIGVGVSLGALWWLARNPKTHVQLDLTRRHVQLVRIGLSGRHLRRLSFDDLEAAEVEQGSDSEGGAIWRPVVRLRDGHRVLLSELWSHDQAGWRRVWQWWRRPAESRCGTLQAGSRRAPEDPTEVAWLPHLTLA
jgi:hypothetical protein